MQLLLLTQCSPLLHKDADTIVLPLGIVYIKIFHDVLLTKLKKRQELGLDINIMIMKRKYVIKLL